MITQEMVEKLFPLPEKPAAAGGPPIAGLRLRAQAIWEETVYADSSKRDARFFLELLREGRSEDDAWQALCRLPGGKASGGRQDESYRVSTVEWGRRAYSDDQRLLGLCRRLKADDACLPAAVSALCRLRELRPRKFAVAMERLKTAGADMQRLKSAIKAMVASDAAAAMGDRARHACQEGKSVGWWLLAPGPEWNAYKFGEFQATLRGQNLPADHVVAALTATPWTIVNIPFGPEEIITGARREWNRNPAELAYQPLAGAHPMWDQVLRVCGRSIDHLWPAGGADYLLRWIASCIQRPNVKLPWLFFHGDENVGKSTFHEVLKRLLKRGYTIANEALLNDRGFNKELAGAVICVVEEIELKRQALRRIKLWTTGETIQIHEKGATPYDLANTCHFIQTGNKPSDCPISVGDTRITAIRVDAPDTGDAVAKDVIFERCAAEAPAFIATLLGLKLKPVAGRLGLPVLTTAEKKTQQAANRSELEVWIDAHPEWVTMSDEKVCNAFQASLPTIGDWDRGRIIRELPPSPMRELSLSLREFTGRIVDLSKLLGWSRSTETLATCLGHGVDGFTVRQAAGAVVVSRV